MAAVTPADPSDSVSGALSQLRTHLSELTGKVAAYKQENELSAAELQQLSESASSGELGADMQAAANLVASGQDTWQAMFAGDSSNAGLIVSNFDRSVSENSAAVRAGLGS
ncbi:hypothetical protein [Nocardia sp. XZ_19_385]|uniref:hypothetical protein n=1 Tax=Nocardia sp. XZ_19_385 TaxID=2769488 RepID=UPI00188E416E|nr:hypothetical protein [Nocardia sp. XZ_19_385]